MEKKQNNLKEEGPFIKKMRNGIQYLEGEKKILGFNVKKRHLFIGGVIIIAYILFELSMVIFKPGMMAIDSNTSYEKILNETKNEVNKNAKSEPLSNEEMYQKAIDRIKNLPTSEIQKLLREQNINNVSDKEIEDMKKKMIETMPKSEAELKEKTKQAEEIMKGISKQALENNQNQVQGQPNVQTAPKTQEKK